VSAKHAPEEGEITIKKEMLKARRKPKEGALLLEKRFGVLT
jgi:hypothetical protein